MEGDSDDVVPPGSTVTVAAHLRHVGPGQNLDVSAGRFWTVGELEWDGSGRSSLTLSPQQVGAAAWRGSGAAAGDRFGAYGGTILDDDTFFIKALQSSYNDDDTGQFWFTGTGKIYIYDVPTKTEVAVITPPAGASATAFTRGFAAYQEDADTGWIFVGSWRDTVTISGASCYSDSNGRSSRRTDRTSTGTDCQTVGRVYIYKLDRSASPMTVSSTPCATLTPSAADAAYAETTSEPPLGARFGIALAVNETTDTLAVGAGKMHLTGAIKVFTKPTSAGGWCDLSYGAATATLTPAPIQAEGMWSSASNLQKSYAGRRWSDGHAGSGFGEEISFSDDGNTLASGTFLKYHDDNYQNYVSGFTDAGEVTIFTRPGTGWADDATPTARLLVTPTVNQQRLGQYLSVSNDGSAIAAAAPQRANVNTSPGYVYVWNRPAGGWSGDITGAHATLSAAGGRNRDQFGHNSVDFNHDGTRLAVSNHLYQDSDTAAEISFAGRAWLFLRPAGGSWANATTAAETAIEIKSPQPRRSAYFGIARFSEDGDRVIVTQYEDSSSSQIQTGSGAVWLFDENLMPMFFAGSACSIDAGQAVRDSSDDINTCPLILADNSDVTIPLGTKAGTYTISGRVTVEGQVFRATLALRVGEVKEVDSATLEVGTDTRGTPGTDDDQPHKTSLEAGQSTVLRLRILNENGRASAADSVASILVTATKGALSTNINDAERAPAAFSTASRNQDGCVGTGGLVCEIRVASLNGTNSDKIDITLRAPSPAQPGRDTVRVTVLSRAGDTIVTEPVTVVFAGAAAKLAISEPTTGVLNVNTATGANDDAETRDRLRFSVSAADANDNNANVPTTPRSTRILDPKGEVVWRSISPTSNFAVAWPLKKADGTTDDKDADDNLQVQIDVNAPDTAPLKNGEYTLEVTANSLKATQTFTVSGGPETIVISEPDSDALTIGGRFTLTATLSDADGAAVPDGTPVTFKASATGVLPVLVKVQETAKTKDGQASVTYEVIAAGRDSVRVSSGAAGEVRLITTTDSTPVAPPAPVNPADSLTPRMPNDYSTWLGQGTTTAAALLDGLGEGFRSILFWYEGRWLRYAVSDGRPVPSSMNFEVPRGAILWLSNGG